MLQKQPVIPTAVCTALLEVLAALEFLDLTFRDPRQRFSKTTNTLNRSMRRSYVDLQAKDDQVSDVSIFATIPRSIKKIANERDSDLAFNVHTSDHDSVEDLMLDLSITAAAQKKAQPAYLPYTKVNISGDDTSRSCGAASVPESKEVVTHVCKDSQSLSQVSYESSNVFLSDSADNAALSSLPSGIINAHDRARRVEDPCGTQPPPPPNTTYASGGGGQLQLTKLSTTNISHIEHFSQTNSRIEHFNQSDNSEAIYVTSDDVRRRKKKRRFLSKINRKKDKGSSVVAKDIRRYSIYECLPGRGDVDNSLEKSDSVYSSLRQYARIGGKKRAHNTAMGSRSSLCPSTASSGLPAQEHNQVSSSGCSLSTKNSLLYETPSWTECSDTPLTTPSPSSLLRAHDIERVNLPPNSCFETAFTSDSPKTRIIPQKSVDTLHLRQIKRRRRNNLSASGMPRPKSIAVPSYYHEDDILKNCQLDYHGCHSRLSNSAANINSSIRNWSASPSMLDISGPCQKLSVSDLALDSEVKRTILKSLPADNNSSFSKCRSTGDLNMDWMHEREPPLRSCSPAAPSKGLGLMSRVRDSMRRRKAKDGHRKLNRNTANISSNPSSCNSSVCPSINSSCNSKHFSDIRSISYSNITQVRNLPQIASYIRAGDGNQAINNQRTLQQLRQIPDGIITSNTSSSGKPENLHNARSSATQHRLPSNHDISGGYKNVSPYAGGRHAADNSSDHQAYSDAGSNATSSSIISPIMAEYTAAPPLRSIMRHHTVKSPFSPSSGCETSDTMSMMSLSERSTDALDTASLSTVNCSTATSLAERHVISNCSSLVRDSSNDTKYFSSVSTTNISMDYSKNQQDTFSSLPLSSCTPQHRTDLPALRSTPLPLAARSTSLAFPDTASLACYDESDPQPFTVSSLPRSGDCQSLASDSKAHAHFKESSSEKSPCNSIGSNCASCSQGKHSSKLYHLILIKLCNLYAH